ncbi:MAG: inositol monophosphatase [Actinomycetaceae bacterium]|nr:inositol monophosphatase [Actinomycetaceae bacterium]
MSIELHPLESQPRLSGLDPEQQRTLERADLCHELALMCRAACQSVADYLTVSRTALDESTTQIKSNVHDPVTPYDQATERALSQILGSFIPGSRILGEEHGEEILPGGQAFDLPDEVEAPEPDFHVDARSLASRVRWIVDPIDGTSNFAAGLTYFATSIAAELDGEVVAAAMTAPAHGETYWANEDEGWLEVGGNFYKLASGGLQKEEEAVVLTYFPTTSQLETDPELAAEGYAQIAHAFRAVRRPGAAALDLAQVAAGRAGALFAATLKPWDVAAGVHLVLVSGGTIADRALGTDLPAGLRPAVAAAGAGLEIPTLMNILDSVEAQATRE